MIITAVPIQPRLPALLKACAKPMYDQMQHMTVKEAKNFGGGGTPKVRALVTIGRHKNGTFKSFTGRLVGQSEELREIFESSWRRPGKDVFACLVPYFGGLGEAAEGIGLGLLPVLISDEVDRRYAKGPRELVYLSDEELSGLHGAFAETFASDRGFHGDAISESLLSATVAREIETRKTESAHERLDCIDRHSKTLEEAQETLAHERDRALKNVRPDYWSPSPGMRQNLGDGDRAVLALRAAELRQLMNKLR